MSSSFASPGRPVSEIPVFARFSLYSACLFCLRSPGSISHSWVPRWLLEAATSFEGALAAVIFRGQVCRHEAMSGRLHHRTALATSKVVRGVTGSFNGGVRDKCTSKIALKGST